jgi:hypothetical protein
MLTDSEPSNSGSSVATGIRDFLETNSLVAKFAFIMLVVLIFVIILRMCIAILSAYFSPSGTPRLFDGMVPGNFGMVFDQNPSDKNAITVIRSKDQRGGIEFTWSVWIYLETDVGSTTFKHIFSKGNPNEYASKYTPNQADPTKTGLMFPNNAPGLYVYPGENKLLLIMNTFSNIDEEVEIDNMPMNKWVNLIIRVKDKNLDIFINGIVTKNVQFSTPPRQNYENVNLHLNGGYKGFTSNLWYYNYALGTNAINSIVYWGPNTKLAVANSMLDKNSDYLSSKWYFGGQGDMFNPVGASK